jgi:hypothetical protein
MAATPRAAHSFARARSFDVGLVIVWSPWWVLIVLLGPGVRDGQGLAAESDFIGFTPRKSTFRARSSE